MEQHIGFATAYASGVAPRDVIVRDEADHDSVSVVGLSADEVEAAVRMLATARLMSSEARRTLRTQVLAVLVADQEALASPDDVKAAQGVASLRARLMDSAHYSYETLAEVRETSSNAVRTWVKRARDAGTLFTVQQRGRTLLPAFQFDESGGVNPDSAAVVAVLRAGGLDGWQLWEWMSSPTGWLDGGVPAELLRSEPDVVLTVAREHAEELSLGRQAVSSAKDRGTAARQ